MNLSLYKLYFTLLFLFSTLYLSSCKTIPVTGRQSFSILPESMVTSMALDSYRQIISKSKLSQDKEKVAMVRRVGQRIAEVANQPKFEWEFNLIENDAMVNAFAMPGGKVAVYTGILKVAQNETGLAVVMGHEVAHAIAGHGNERMSEQLLLNFGAISLATALKNKPEKTQALFMTAFGLGTQIGVSLPFGRFQESEADRIGLIYMAKAGYDPREAPSFWTRMGSSSGGQAPPEFLSTHPSHNTRTENLKKWMPEALAVYPNR